MSELRESRRHPRKPKGWGRRKDDGPKRRQKRPRAKVLEKFTDEHGNAKKRLFKPATDEREYDDLRTDIRRRGEIINALGHAPDDLRTTTEAKDETDKKPAGRDRGG